MCKVHGKSNIKPTVFIKQPKISIKAKKNEYVVVLDKSGNVTGTHPIMEFEIVNGPPQYLFEVQVARRYRDLLLGGPGLKDAWDKTKPVKERIWQRAFSSWSNGEKTLKLDRAGKAKYKMPLEWWRDQARIEKKHFIEAVIHYRVLAFRDATAKTIFYSVPDRNFVALPKTKIKNNLIEFKVYKLRYHKDGATVGMWRRYARIEFKVHEENTTEMYSMVQWKKGGRKYEDNTDVWGVTDYNVQHTCKYPKWQIDRLTANPRYWDGSPTKEADNKTSYYEDDVSCGPPDDGHTEVKLRIDFISKMHVDFDIPAAVTIKTNTNLPDGKKDIYEGAIDENKTLILAEASWFARLKVFTKPTGGFGYLQL